VQATGHERRKREREDKHGPLRCSELFVASSFKLNAGEVDALFLCITKIYYYPLSVRLLP
jgi:hypothetical protein